MHVHLNTTCTRYLQRPEDGVRCSGIVVTEGWIEPQSCGRVAPFYTFLKGVFYGVTVFAVEIFLIAFEGVVSLIVCSCSTSVCQTEEQMSVSEGDPQRCTESFILTMSATLGNLTSVVELKKTWIQCGFHWLFFSFLI